MEEDTAGGGGEERKTKKTEVSERYKRKKLKDEKED